MRSVPTMKLKALLTDDPPDEILVQSIRENGIMTPLVIRDNNVVVDGRERLKAARLLGLETVPCRIIFATDEDLVKMTLIQSVQRIKTKPVEFARQLQRIDLPRAELARKIQKSERWIANRLALLNLCPEVAEMVDSEQMTLKRGIELSKLTHEEQRLKVADGNAGSNAEQSDAEDD